MILPKAKGVRYRKETIYGLRARCDRRTGKLIDQEHQARKWEVMGVREAAYLRMMRKRKRIVAAKSGKPELIKRKGYGVGGVDKGKQFLLGEGVGRAARAHAVQVLESGETKAPKSKEEKKAEMLEREREFWGGYTVLQ